MAISAQDKQEITDFLEANGFKNINALNDANPPKTPLTVAMDRGDMRMFELLLSHPEININQTDQFGRTPVWIAADRGKVDYLEKLADKNANLEKADHDKATPLLTSVRKSCFNATAFIVHRVTGYSLYNESDFGQHPIHALCKFSPYDQAGEEAKTKMLDLLRKNNVDLNARNENGETPLIFAAQRGNLFAMKWLIKNGADLTAQDKEGNNFLSYLSPANQAEIFKLEGMNANWSKDIAQVKEFGHVLGIGSFLKLGSSLGFGGIVQVPVQVKDNKLVPANLKAQKILTTPVFTESWDSTNAYKTLQKEVESFAGENKHFARLNESLKVFADAKDVDKIPKEQFFDLYQAGQPAILPLTVPGHGLGLAIYKDKLIYTDRFLTSGGKVDECTKIFNLKSTDPEVIKKLTEELSGKQESLSSLMQKLNEHVDFDKPIMVTGDRMQAHGTCTYSNPRSNLEGILCVMRADKNKATIDPADVKAFKKVAKSDYRDFLHLSRYNKAQELVKVLQEAHKNGDPARAKMYFDLAEGYMRGHHDKNKNGGLDWNNTMMMYKGLPEKYKNEFDNRNVILGIKLERALKTEAHADLKKHDNRKSNPLALETKAPLSNKKSSEESSTKFWGMNFSDYKKRAVSDLKEHVIPKMGEEQKKSPARNRN